MNDIQIQTNPLQHNSSRLPNSQRPEKNLNFPPTIQFSKTHEEPRSPRISKNPGHYSKQHQHPSEARMETREIAILVNHPVPFETGVSSGSKRVEQPPSSRSSEQPNEEEERKKGRVSINAWYRRTHQHPQLRYFVYFRFNYLDEWEGVGGNLERQPLRANYFNYSRVAG